MVYQTDGRFWPTKRCELNINGPGWPNAWQPPALAAMNSWNGSGASFRFASVAGAPDHLAAYDMGRWNGWLAVTRTTPQSQGSPLTSAYVLVNAYNEWDPAHPTLPHTSQSGPFDLESVLVHEFGHLLHLKDEPTAQDVMQPTIKPSVTRRAIGTDDKAGIAYLYPMIAEMDVAQLARESLLVVRGTVLASNFAVFSRQIVPQENAPDLLFSVSRVRVDAEFTGKSIPPPEVDVLTLGAYTPQRSLDVQGDAVLAPNEDVVLFLSKDHQPNSRKISFGHWLPLYLPVSVGPSDPPNPNSSYSVYGGFQGKYSVFRQNDISYAWRRGIPPAARYALPLQTLQEQVVSAR